jgi:hypothetical protein
MSESKHTPGPWSVEPFQDCWPTATNGAQITIPSPLGKTAIACAHALWDRDGGKAAAEANAKLIAAAPDQHEAAKEIDGWSLVIESAVREAQPHHAEAIVNALLANRAAIAKGGERG